MTSELDPSLLAWVRGIADAAPQPTRAQKAKLREERRRIWTELREKRTRDAREGRERTAAWLRVYLGDGDWHECNAIRAASLEVGIRNQWLSDSMKSLCEFQHRGLHGGYWRLRRRGKRA